MPIDILFDFVSVHVNGERAAGVDFRIDLVFTDGGGETWTMWIKRGVLNARRGAAPETQLTVTGPKAALVGVLLKPAADRLVEGGAVQLEGDESVLQAFAGVLDDFDPNFPIVTP
jgi:alkyl sulfatase BDS1-like metallo-beta-lactamase superfamily hydrolase